MIACMNSAHQSNRGIGQRDTEYAPNMAYRNIFECDSLYKQWEIRANFLFLFLFSDQIDSLLTSPPYISPGLDSLSNK